MAEARRFNLFVYGTLMSPSVFRAVLGRRLVTRKSEADGLHTFYARRAVLNGFKKVTPDNTYLYAVPAEQGRIRGYVIEGLGQECMAALRKYEGRNYSRCRARVQTARGEIKAWVFAGNLEQMEHSFGYEFRDHFKQEILLNLKIEAALADAERAQRAAGDPASPRAVGQLRGSKIRDLRRKHFEAGGISDYTIRHSLTDAPLPDFSRIADDPVARALAPNYLAMVVRQVFFNVIEGHIRRDLRYELDRMSPGAAYHDRTVSSLAALRTLNRRPALVNELTRRCLDDVSFNEHHLVDFVERAVTDADAIYADAPIRRHYEFIRNHMGRGHTPLGAELEFSNIGHDVIRDPQGRDRRDSLYDGFFYFLDFALNVLTWKLGGHLDDHHLKFSSEPRRGFFEVSPGIVSVEANLSKPMTDDPWILNQVIHEIRRFFDITPHSVHISMQIRGRRPAKDRLLPLSIMKCLFAIAGDPGPDDQGRLTIRRIVGGEIIEKHPHPHMLFSDVKKRHSSDSDSSYPFVRPPSTKKGRYVQQFKFLRLDPGMNYEPIVMALKGIQISLAPSSFLTGDQYLRSPAHRACFDDLLAWGSKPTPLSGEDIEGFLGPIYDGLLAERKGKPAHSGAYIAWSINQLRQSLARFNEMTENPEPRPAGPGKHEIRSSKC